MCEPSSSAGRRFNKYQQSAVSCYSPPHISAAAELGVMQEPSGPEAPPGGVSPAIQNPQTGKCLHQPRGPHGFDDLFEPSPGCIDSPMPWDALTPQPTSSGPELPTTSVRLRDTLQGEVAVGQMNCGVYKPCTPNALLQFPEGLPPSHTEAH